MEGSPKPGQIKEKFANRRERCVYEKEIRRSSARRPGPGILRNRLQFTAARTCEEGALKGENSRTVCHNLLDPAKMSALLGSRAEVGPN